MWGAAPRVCLHAPRPASDCLAMPTLDLDQLLALLSVVVAVTILSPTGAAIVLAFALGLLCNVKRRAD